VSETSQISQPLLEYATREKGAYGWKAHGSIYTLRGNPDIILCVAGLFVGIECKLPGEKPTTLQALRLRQIREAGGRSYVVDNLELGKALIDWLFSEAERLGSRFALTGPVTSFAPPALRGQLEAPKTTPAREIVVPVPPPRASIRRRGAQT